MWQITWILNFLPDWVWTLLLIVSIALILLSRFFLAYKLPMKIGGAVALVLSVWMLGAASNEANWEARVKELEEKLLIAEAESKKVNEVVVEKIVTQTKVVQGKAKTIVEYVDREVVKDKEIIKYVEMCPVPAAIIDTHNDAARLNETAEGAKK